jgi:uncharacterized protein YndB with AHSA1/START domain
VIAVTDVILTDTSVTLVRTIPAPARDVFAAWTDPSLLQRWLAASAEADARLGGRYRLEAHGEDGPVQVVSGEYREFVPARRLVASWVVADPTDDGGTIETLLTVDLRELAPSVTELTVREEEVSDRSSLPQGTWADAQVAWSAALDTLAAIL